MKLGYKRLGDYIQLVDERNRNVEVTNLLGISVTKNFIPSVANIVGTDMANYKIVRKNQFACSIMQVRRDKKMPVALYLEDKPSIISQAYPIFQVIDESVLLPEYLMMWFTRSEFDREACFLAVGGVRGSLEWEDFLNMELPIPSPEKQKELIEEYEAIEKRIQLNKKLCATLEETAQTIYKHWFEDFEFPDENGKPYKSSGGEMVECEELGKEIPKGWKIDELKSLHLDISDGNYSGNYPKSYEFKKEGIPFIRGTDFNESIISKRQLLRITPEKHQMLKKGHLKKNDLLFSNRANIGSIAYVTSEFIDCNINSQLLRINGKKLYSQFFLGLYFTTRTFKNLLLGASTGSAQLQLPIGNFNKIRHIIPNQIVIQKFDNEFDSVHFQILNKKIMNQKLEDLKSLLLGKMAVEV
ncbi:restriction endonuclease subunit S [Chryseobacterium sp. SNU WT5]|uniref:restriction endonuclease subunit S n=1 Tax=Chryseobacterium sp. SNU WT5 TaxID=2594269 RepID=UPI001627EC87|nr:restriction endonuclease subunit S [Chryseobacterium sp. SNU WT5]